MNPENVKKARKVIGRRCYCSCRISALKKMYRLTVDAFILREIGQKDADRLMMMYAKKMDWYYRKIENG